MYMQKGEAKSSNYFSRMKLTLQKMTRLTNTVMNTSFALAVRSEYFHSECAIKAELESSCFIYLQAFHRENWWQWCWWLYDGDWFEVLVAESLWFSHCRESVTNILNRSPTSQTCHQHINPKTYKLTRLVTYVFLILKESPFKLFHYFYFLGHYFLH